MFLQTNQVLLGFLDAIYHGRFVSPGSSMEWFISPSVRSDTQAYIYVHICICIYIYMFMYTYVYIYKKVTYESSFLRGLYTYCQVQEAPNQ